jgi:hypothetical protein
MAEKDETGAVVPLTKRLRALLGTLFGALSLAHVVRPALGIDAISVGLLVAAVALIFFDIDGFEWKGLKVRRLQQRVDQAEDIVKSVTVSTEKAALPALPDPAKPEPAGVGFQGLVHQVPLELNPPVDLLERLLWAYEQIRIELVVISGNAGRLTERVTFDRYQPRRLASELITNKRLPEQLAQPIDTVSRLRNEVVHSSTRLTQGLLESSATLAIDVLLKVRSVKRGYFRVRTADVVLYRDQSLSQLHDAAGVEIVSFDDTGAISSIGVYPSQSPYTRGRFVTWEWTFDRVFYDEAWYRDPATNLAKLAFSSAATFVGREYPAQWGLEFHLPQPDTGLTGGPV